MKKAKNLLKKILPMFLTAIALSMTVSAGNYIDTDMTGSITMTLTRDAKTVDVSDGTIEIYHVANIVADEFGEYAYEYTEDFKGCVADLSEPSESSLPDMLIEYIDNCGIGAYANTVPSHGTASFSSIPLGVYLVRETKASAGYYEFLPFVVTVPVSEGGVISYDVNASPKLETIIPTETETEQATESVTEQSTEQTPESQSEQQTESKTSTPTSITPNGGSTTGLNDEEAKGDGSTVQTGDYMTYGMLMILIACVMVFAIIGIRLRKNSDSEK